MTTSTIILITLLALLLGVMIPVLVQLRATLKAMERRLEATGTRLERILDDSHIVAHRLARVSGGLEGGEDSVRDFMEAVGDLSRVMNRVSGWMGIATSLGAAVGPAVASAVRAYRAAPPEDANLHYAEDMAATREEPGHGEPGIEAPAEQEPFHGGFASVENEAHKTRQQQQQRRGI